jgi:hypothetical protein
MPDGRSLRLRIGLLACLSIALAYGMPAPVHAEEQQAETWPFAPGRLSLGAETGGGFTAAHGVRDAKLYALFGRIGYVLAEQRVFLPGSLEVVAEPNYLYVWEGTKTSNLFGFTADLKYNFRTGTRFVPFVEGGGGISYATTRIPAGQGTNFNFIAQGGLGLQYVLSQRTSLELRGIYHHLSNANTGRDNPSLNSFILSLGVSYHF